MVSFRKRNFMVRIWGGWVFRIYVAVLLIIPATLSCSKPPPFNSMSEYEQFQYIKECVQKNRLTTAKQWLNQYLVVHPGSVVRDSVRYLLGETYYRLEQYILAASEYDHLTTEMPNSSIADDASYKKALCYFKMSPGYQRDQEYTQKAILYFQRLSEYYPNTEYIEDVNAKILELRGKLGRKRYETGKLYQKMGDFQAAVITYSQVLKEFFDSKWAPLALRGKGECHVKLKEYVEAKESFEDFLTRFPKHQDAAMVKEELTGVEKNLPAQDITEKSSR